MPKNVALASCRAPLVTNICGDVYDLEGCQKTIVYAFLQAVCIEGLVEIADVRLVAGLLGRSRHTQLNGIAEILQNFTPVAVVLGTASMTLINDDHIEELGFEELLILLFAIFSYQLLIEREVDFMSSSLTVLVLLIANLMNGVGQWLEILFDRLVNQHVAIGQIEHFLDESGLQQTINYLEGGIGLSCTRGHH